MTQVNEYMRAKRLPVEIRDKARRDRSRSTVGMQIHDGYVRVWKTLRSHPHATHDRAKSSLETRDSYPNVYVRPFLLSCV